MSPEQAKGTPVDRRADIWAFGVLLHEMLTGTKLWIGETAAETLAHVITRDVDLAALPPSVPPRLRTLIARCLVKDPKSRLRDIGEARVALGEMLSGQMDVPGLRPAHPARAGFASRLPWGVAILAANRGDHLCRPLDAQPGDGTSAAAPGTDRTARRQILANG